MLQQSRLRDFPEKDKSRSQDWTAVVQEYRGREDFLLEITSIEIFYSRDMN